MKKLLSPLGASSALEAIEQAKVAQECDDFHLSVIGSYVKRNNSFLRKGPDTVNGPESRMTDYPNPVFDGEGGASARTGTALAGELIEDIYTLSPVQQGMLFHILSAPDRGLYFDQTVCTVTGRLDVDALQWAWEALLARHPALRTSFVWDGLSKPVQVVHRRIPLDFRILDWRRMGKKVRKVQFEVLLEEDRQRGLEHGEPPLLRIHLVRLGDDRYLLLWSVSHLVADGWCSAILLDEVVSLYEGRRRGEDPRLLPAAPYRDFVAWLKRRDLGDAEAYWRRVFRHFSEPSPLAPDIAPRPDGPRPGSRQEGLEFSKALSSALRERAKAWQLTLNSLMQGAWALLLSLEAETDDVVFGVTVSGRSAMVPGVESMVGLLVNTLPMRLRIAPEAPARGWLEALQRSQVELREFEYSPLSRVQGWAGLEAGKTLFDSIFVFLNAFDPRHHDTGSLALEDLRHLSRPHYPVSLQVVPAEEIRIDCVYAAEKFRWARVCTWLETLEVMLATLVEVPGARLCDLLDKGREHRLARGRERRRHRRDSNSDSLRDTKPVPIQLEEPE